MINQYFSFQSIALGIIKLFVVLVIGYTLSRANVLKKDAVRALSDVLVWACLPALIFAKTTYSFSPAEYPLWWFLPVCAIAVSFLGLAAGYFFQKPVRKFDSRRDFMISCAFQNSGYLPIALVSFICSQDICDKVLVYIFLFLIGFNMIIWSFVPAFMSRQPNGRFNPRTLFYPPFIATVLAVLSVFVFGKGWVPLIIYEPLNSLGSTTYPLALIVLGAYLSEHKGVIPDSWSALASCLFAKLVFLPAAVLIILRYIPVDPSYKFIILLESAMPTALSLIAIGNTVPIDNKFLSGIIFYSHLLAIITIPVWLAAFKHFIF